MPHTCVNHSMSMCASLMMVYDGHRMLMTLKMNIFASIPNLYHQSVAVAVTVLVMVVQLRVSQLIGFVKSFGESLNPPHMINQFELNMVVMLIPLMLARDSQVMVHMLLVVGIPII